MSEATPADETSAGFYEGKIINLSEGRSVWVGRCQPATATIIRLTNRRGDVTQFAITQEARSALLQLLLEDCA